MVRISKAVSAFFVAALLVFSTQAYAVPTDFSFTGTFAADDDVQFFGFTANGTSTVRLINNLFVGSGTILTGAAANMTTNLQTTAPGLADIDGYDYRLTAGSSARDAGSGPGLGDGFDLAPVYQYLHKRDRELRPTNGTIDIGAYEFLP